MRVAMLAAGAGGMYCGSCLRDNRIAGSLIAAGRDVVLIPLYTPLRTDESYAGTQRVFFGGINVYLKHRSGLLGRIVKPIGRLLDSPAFLRAVTRCIPTSRPESLGPLTVSVLQGPDGPLSGEVDRLLAGLEAIRPDLIHLPNLMFAGLIGPLKEALGVLVVCSLSGEDLFVGQLPQPHLQTALDLIAKGAAKADALVAPTRYYAEHAAARFGIDAGRVHVVEMGVGLDDLGRPAKPPEQPFTIGFLARISPEKGLLDLCRNFVEVRRRGYACRLKAAGYLPRNDRSYLRQVRRYVEEEGLAGDFEYVGELDRAGKIGFLRTLHVLSVPTVYHEAKGLYLLEAMACGVPVVQPDQGSFREIVQATGGGLLYDPAVPDAARDAIIRMMDDPSLRARLADSGRRVVHESFSAGSEADRLWTLYQRIGTGGAVESPTDRSNNLKEHG